MDGSGPEACVSGPRLHGQHHGRLPKLLCHQLGNGCSLCNGAGLCSAPGEALSNALLEAKSFVAKESVSVVEVFPFNDSHVVPFVPEKVLWMVPPSLLYICLPVPSTLFYMFSAPALYNFGVFCRSKGLGAK